MAGIRPWCWPVLALSLTGSGGAGAAALPEGFVHLETVAPGIRQEMRYAGSDNFVGRPFPGYLAARCILTRAAAERLARIQLLLAQKQLGLKVFDCYRPQRAVDFLLVWSADAGDQRNKSRYYPDVPKAQLFDRGYLARRSGHSRGSTVDLTVVALPGAAAPMLPGRLKPDGEADMGSGYDWLGVESHPDHPGLPPPAVANRRWLAALMADYGFRGLSTEWWHYTLVDEPFPDTYFDFPVE